MLNENITVTNYRDYLQSHEAGQRGGMATVRCLSLLLFTVAVLVAFGAYLVSGGQMRHERPAKPGDWICLTTAGGTSVHL